VGSPWTPGRQHIVMDDGTEWDFNPGDAFVILPGYDGWVVGDEPAVGLDWHGAVRQPCPRALVSTRWVLSTVPADRGLPSSPARSPVQPL